MGAIPVPLPFSVTVEETQEPIVASGPALETGAGSTVTTTASEAVHPYVSVTVSVYVVVEEG